MSKLSDYVIRMINNNFLNMDFREFLAYIRALADVEMIDLCVYDYLYNAHVSYLCF